MESDRNARDEVGLLMRALLSGARPAEKPDIRIDAYAAMVASGLLASLSTLLLGNPADPRSIARYVRSACLREDRFLSPSDSRIAEAVIRFVMGEPGIVTGIPMDDQGRVACGLIVDIAKTLRLSADDLEEVIRAAEAGAAAATEQ
ncbi:hypothetical protein AB0M47_36340 [Hamadaea sp. NPDC051192]|uniref:hypothetical protein n=1 Tax=Hamadaea sp. NPDC051192 TaxID=3154940 RepID=UPI0034422AA1